MRIHGLNAVPAALALALAASACVSTGTPARHEEVPEAAEAVRLDALAMAAHGSELRSSGHYGEAFRLLLKAEAAVEDSFGSDSIELAATLNQFGIAAKYAGEFDAATSAYHRALAILEGRRGYDVQRADLYHNLGGVEHARRRFAAGEPYARRSVAIRTRVLGSGSVETAADQVALAALLEGQRRYEEAERLYLGALTTFERAYGPVHLEVAISCNNLAALYQARQQFDRAEPLYLRALQIKQELLGPGHPEIAMTLNNLGVFYKRQKRYPEAASMYERALIIFQSALGSSHPSVTTCRENYARLRRSIAAEQEKP